MTCNECQNLGIGININEKHKHCNRCGCPSKWNFKLQNPLPNSDKNGWWEEILTGEIHWNKCEEFKKKCAEIKQNEKDTVPVGSVKSTQNTLSGPQQKPETVIPEPKVDEEFLKIIRICGEVEKGIYQVSQEIFMSRKTGSVDDIADRLVQIYSTRKINERLDKIIQELDGRKD